MRSLHGSLWATLMKSSSRALLTPKVARPIGHCYALAKTQAKNPA
jgi:hypothetical protein